MLRRVGTRAVDCREVFGNGLSAREVSGISGPMGGGGDKNVIHITSMPKHWYLQRFLSQASMPSRPCPKHWCLERFMPKALVFTGFSSLCTTGCTRMWNKKVDV